MTTIERGARVRVLASGATGVIDGVRPRQRGSLWRVTDHANRVTLGWFSAAELGPCERPTVSEEIQAAVDSAMDILRSPGAEARLRARREARR